MRLVRSRESLRHARLTWCWVALVFAAAVLVAAQADPEPVALIARFFAASDAYEQIIRNLSAEETKTIETFDGSGKLDRRRVVVSDLVVYASPRGGVTEFRDVRSVDGKPVNRRGERALELVTRAMKADSLERELESINRETRRYEFGMRIQGGTIHQGGVVKEAPEAFEFSVSGREQIAGREVAILSCEPLAPVPGYKVSLASEFGDPPLLHRARLWIDVESGQLWRTEWEGIVKHPAVADPLVFMRQTSIYASSAFGTPLPERMVVEAFTHVRHAKNPPTYLALSHRTTFVYGPFKRFEVTTTEQIAPRRER